MEAELWEQKILVSINHLFVKLHGQGLLGFVCIGCLLRKRNVQVGSHVAGPMYATLVSKTGQ
jgi:hypothetical protein